MKILAFESSTAVGGVALWVRDQIVSEKLCRQQRSHSEVLHDYVNSVLDESHLGLDDIDAFAVGQGPGSFTGIRVAASAGMTFAYLKSKPLLAVDSLTLLASNIQDDSRPVLAIMNAYKNMVYVATYLVRPDEPRLLEAPRALPLKDLQSKVTSDMTVVGDGFQLLGPWLSPEALARLHRLDGIPDHPLPSTLARVAAHRLRQGRTLDWKSFSPLYLRASEAEENLQGQTLKG